MRLLRFKEVREMVGLSRSTIWRMEREGLFPPRKKISRNATAWLEEEIRDWIATRKNAAHLDGKRDRDLSTGQDLS